MLENLRIHKLLWQVSATLAFLVAVIGVNKLEIYDRIVQTDILPGALSQDLITVAVAIVMLVLAVSIREKDYKKQIVLVGLTGYLFYAYGIYVIERTYNSFYLIYMAIFALSFWSLIYSLYSLRKDIFPKVNLRSNAIRRLSAAGALLQPLLFYPLWISALLPLMQTGKQIDQLYSIYIIDLCFIMPAFAICAYLTFKKHALGLLLTPAIYILGFTLIFSLVVGELVKPRFDDPINIAALIQSSLLSGLFMVLGLLHLRNLRFSTKY